MNELQNILDREGLTQTTFAAMCGISGGTINKICRQKLQPSSRHKHIIMKALNKYAEEEKYTVEFIFSGEK